MNRSENRSNTKSLSFNLKVVSAYPLTSRITWICNINKAIAEDSYLRIGIAKMRARTSRVWYRKRKMAVMVMSTLHALSACSLPLTEGKPSVPNRSVLVSKGRALLIEALRWSCPRHWIYLNLLKSKSFHLSIASSTNMAISTLISRRLEDLVSSSMIINELK